MPICVRAMRAEDARAFLEVLRDAIRGIAVADYPPEVIGAWAPLVTEEDVERVLENPDDEVRFVAESEGRIIGLGAIIPQNLRAEGLLRCTRRRAPGRGDSHRPRARA